MHLKHLGYNINYFYKSPLMIITWYMKIYSFVVKLNAAPMIPFIDILMSKVAFTGPKFSAVLVI